jgi:hypothetical protein
MNKQKTKLVEDSMSKIGLGFLMSGSMSMINNPKLLIIGGFIHCNRGIGYNI